MKNILSLESKNVIITGGLGLIGKAVCRMAAEQGAYVVICDMDDKRGAQFESELRDDGLNCTYKRLDITSEEQVSALVADIEESSGAIDGWVNLAYPRTMDWGAKFEDVALESWRKNLDMQLNGLFICCKAVLENMKLKRSGSVVNFSSIQGLVGPNFRVYDGTDMTSPAAYAAIKGGTVNFTRYLANYYGEYNVRVNAVAPGGVFDNQNPVFVEKYNTLTPLGRMAKAEDIAPCVIFLLCDGSSYITGQTIAVDGGWCSW